MFYKSFLRFRTVIFIVHFSSGKQLISCRQTLYWLLFTGWIVNFMLKMGLNLAIVSMVVPRIKEPIQAQCSNYVKDDKEFNEDDDSNVTLIDRTFNVTQYDITTTLATLSSNIKYQGRFNWTEYDQGLALGAFFWSFWMTSVPGGLLARYYGTKIVFGGSNFVACLIVLLIPVVVKYHFYAFLALRVTQGFFMGLAMPSMHTITSEWIPPSESSKFVSAYNGGSVGTAVTYVLMATIIYYFNWEAAFYTTSVVGLIWCCFWVYYAHDSPLKHSRISKSELKYIMDNLKHTSHKNNAKIPWFKILMSVPFWATILANWGGTWGFWTLLVQGPTYFSFIHGWDINAAGVISGAPNILLMIFSFLFGALCDWLLKTNKMSRTAVRKLAVLTCNGIQAIFLIGLSLSGCHSNLAIVFMMLGTIMTGAISAGTIINLVDLSPNYSSVLLGILTLVSNTAGAVSPLIVGILTNDNQTIGQWRLVFFIAAGCLAGSAIIYVIWGTAEEQPWNNLKGHNDDENGEEMQKLNLEEKLKITIDVKRKTEGAQEESEKLNEEKDVKVRN